MTPENLGGRFGYFLLGGGEGAVRGERGGFLIENPRGGGLERGGEREGAGRVSAGIFKGGG